MVTEKATITAIETDALQVSTIAQSTCNRCVAKAGCGQRVLNRLTQQSTYLRVVSEAKDLAHYRVGDQVVIGIPDGIVVKSASVVYILPLVFMLVFSGFAHMLWKTDGASVIAAAVGLLIGAWSVVLYSGYYRDDRHHQPFVVGVP
ncbi:MAG: SoxR reducing system RseC family protein [Cellvibrionaceae bacterium]|nr:SoxR reducing system RseC family protein [Cellvibrionaceae bacterium]